MRCLGCDEETGNDFHLCPICEDEHEEELESQEFTGSNT